MTAAALLAELAELGALNGREVASLAGVAPVTRESGLWSGHSFIGDGHVTARRALYVAALSASRYHPHLRAFHARLSARGKPKKVALVAVMRKLLVPLNSRMWQLTPVPS